MGTILNLCQDWQFHPGFSKDDLRPGGDFETVCLPHTVREVPMAYLDERSYQIHSCYRRRLPLGEEHRNQRLFLDFGGVMTACTVYLNGEEIAFHKGGYTPFSVEITHFVRCDGSDTVTLHVDSTERPDTPPFGHVVDYLCFGGVYREVSLRCVPQSYIQDVFARPEKVLSGAPTLRTDVQYTCTELARLTVRLRDGETVLASACTDLTPGEGTATVSLEHLSHIRLWTLDDPALYEVEAELSTASTLDQTTVRTGFRTAAFTPDGFLLNGQPLKLLGLNRHQAYPYVGYAMPRRAQRRDADLLKFDLGCHLVRTSHYPQSPHFLDRCDEIGLLVFTELPGWQFVGDIAWQDQACQDLTDLILRDRNHPSVILWGVRVNESHDNHDFYTRTNAIAHHLDPTRQTGGVRCFKNGELLEDVYTYNDFAHDGGETVLLPQREVTGLDHDVPYLVAENNGHMYPTKRFDGEERKIEHALRHLRVLEAACADPHSCGMTAWCAFDYNTHKDFGSGDKICHHGVMDMFRIPKFAAHAYASQADFRPVLEPATHWTRGDRSEAKITPIVVFTNCDSVRLISGDEDMGLFRPDREHYPHLPHPPVVIHCADNGWGMDMMSAVFIGYRDGEEVVRRPFTANALPEQLLLTADDDTLTAGPWDTTRLVCTLADSCGNPLFYAFEPVHFTVEGPGSIIGPDTVSLIGGQIGCWLRTTGARGIVRVRAQACGLDAEVTISVQ